MPDHVAARWSAGRGPHAADWHIRRAGRVPAAAFRPPAPASVSVLEIRRR